MEGGNASVAGLRIFGGADKLAEIVEHGKVVGFDYLETASILANGHAEQIRSVCREKGVWMKQLRLDFVEEEAERL